MESFGDFKESMIIAELIGQMGIKLTYGNGKLRVDFEQAIVLIWYA